MMTAGSNMMRPELRSSHSSLCNLLLDAERRLIGLQLVVDADLFVEIVPAAEDGLDGRFLVDFAGEEARDRLAEDHLLILLVLRDTQIEDHVRAIEAIPDGPEVAVAGHLAHAGVLPDV